MIPHSQTQCQSEKVTVQDLNPQSWQRELSQSLLTLDTLLKQVELTPSQIDGFLTENQVPASFPLRATESYIAQIRKGDPNDPLLRQILPLADELIEHPGFSSDPLEEARFNPLPGIVHKYNQRALFVATQACAIHCRYCFRRHFPYADNTGLPHWPKALDYLREDTSLNEVILSGGDPLTLNNSTLRRLLSQLADIPHLRRLRLHTRLPVVLPSRIDRGLLDTLADWPGQTIVVIHCNHANEISTGVKYAIGQLRQLNALVLNQSVLLRGVNDSAEALIDLSNRLFDSDALPYYLHQLDPVAGAAHFTVSDDKARHLIKSVSAHLPGYLVPRLVRELPGDPAKRPL